MEDSAMYYVIKTQEEGCMGKVWWDWTEPLRDRDSKALEVVR